ncbi:MAG TPA: hypothetical protein PLV87_07480 [Opitutaceae bacterium]|nr:hypothetical protein [Opitutaceae bacterium]
MKTLARLLLTLVLSAVGTAGLCADASALKPIRTEAEVLESGRQALARYGDTALAAQGFLDVTKAPYLADPSGVQDATAAIQQALRQFHYCCIRPARWLRLLAGSVLGHAHSSSNSYFSPSALRRVSKF